MQTFAIFETPGSTGIGQRDSMRILLTGSRHEYVCHASGSSGKQFQIMHVKSKDSLAR